MLGAVANSVLNSGHLWQRVGGINFYQISAHTLCPGVEQFLHVLKLILNYMLVLRDYCISFVLCFKYFVIKEEQTWVKFYRSWSIRSESGGLNIVNSIHQILNSTPNTASSNIKWNSQYLQLTSQNGTNKQQQNSFVFWFVPFWDVSYKYCEFHLILDEAVFHHAMSAHRNSACNG